MFGRMIVEMKNFFSVVGIVTLALGGIGVMNIMLVAVRERTREIGVRKALGATKSAILWQFLVEAATLTSIGASIGLVLGILVALGIKNAFPAVPASTPISAVLAALGTSAFTGILFGLLPAARAARLDPVEALRYE
jgi:putative ABC transport system permease protein